MPAGLTWDRVRRRRLWRHSLVERAPASRLAEVAGETCGIHAQLITAAELSIAVRVEGTRRELRKALWEERRLVKTYGKRGTIHLFPAAEQPLWMAARSRAGTLNQEVETSRLNSAGLSQQQARELVEAIGEALPWRPKPATTPGSAAGQTGGGRSAGRQRPACSASDPTAAPRSRSSGPISGLEAGSRQSRSRPWGGLQTVPARLRSRHGGPLRAVVRSRPSRRTAGCRRHA